MIALYLGAMAMAAVPTSASLRAVAVDPGSVRCQTALRQVLQGAADPSTIDDAALCLALRGTAPDIFERLPPSRQALGVGLLAAYLQRDDEALPALAEAYAGEPSVPAAAGFVGLAIPLGDALDMEKPARQLIAEDPLLVVRTVRPAPAGGRRR